MNSLVGEKRPPLKHFSIIQKFLDMPQVYFETVNEIDLLSDRGRRNFHKHFTKLCKIAQEMNSRFGKKHSPLKPSSMIQKSPNLNEKFRVVAQDLPQLAGQGLQGQREQAGGEMGSVAWWKSIHETDKSILLIFVLFIQLILTISRLTCVKLLLK